MLGSLFSRRALGARHDRRVWAAGLCAASFLAGQALFGGEPTPTVILNQYQASRNAVAEAPASSAASQRAAAPQRSAPALRATRLEAIEPSGGIVPASANVPAGDGAPILTPAEAAALRQAKQSNPLRAVPPVTIAPATSTVAPAASKPAEKSPLVEARPLPLRVAEQTPALAPVVSAADLPRPQKTVTTKLPPSHGQWLAEVKEVLRDGNGGEGTTNPFKIVPPSPPAPQPARVAKPAEAPQPPVTPNKGSMPAELPKPAQPAATLNQPVEFAVQTAPVAVPTRPSAAPVAKTSINEPVFLAQPAAPQPLPPAANPAVEFNPLPAGSPFEAIPEAGSVTVSVRRSLLMRTKTDIYRTAVVDETVVDVVQFTPREISLIGRSQGSTHVTFWFDDPATPPLTYLVKVEPDAQVLKEAEFRFQMLEDLINEAFPDSKIRLVPVADKLLVKGQVRDSEEAAQIMTMLRAQGAGLGAGGWGGVGDGPVAGVIPAAATGLRNQPQYQLVNMLRVPGIQQVALKVKIAELNRTAARSFGVGLNANIDFGDLANGTKLFIGTLITPTAGSSVLANISGDDVTLGIRYLQERGVARLLSEPTLVTLSGRPATFVAGGEFAVPTIVGSVGLNAVTTDFRAFGAIISFLPTIVDKDRVRLQVSPEFSQINTGLAVGGTPGLNVRMATTTVEMREGQTLAIAGLLEDNFKATTAGDIPFLAKILGRRNASRNETELIILVTPELVQPLDPEEVPPLPGFDVTEPTGGEFFLHGDIEGTPTRDHRTTVWPHLRKRYQGGGPAMTSGPFGHGQ
ncbi:MAG: pilus assembly protein N-terminal domain-containing protein [Pirellulaceae bacterium]|nr:pilus assembly protein N-terminal domain-containing protein [Pirellulaceae bacterium]